MALNPAFNSSTKPAPGALITAAKDGDMQAVKELLQRGAAVDERDEQDNTPLTEAARAGCVQIMRVLIDKGADINHKNKDGNSAILWCACLNHPDGVSLMIEKGADLNTQNIPGKNTPLILAASYGYADIVRLLIDNGANLDLQDSSGDTAQTCAESRGQAETAEILRNFADSDARMAAEKIKTDAAEKERLIREAIELKRQRLREMALLHKPKINSGFKK